MRFGLSTTRYVVRKVHCVRIARGCQGASARGIGTPGLRSGHHVPARTLDEKTRSSSASGGGAHTQIHN